MMYLKQIKFLIIFPVLLFLSFKSSVILRVEIGNLENSKGQILLELIDASRNSIKTVSQEIKDNRCIIRIENLKPGNYAFRYFHDENSNKELDTNLMGIPVEGYGFSNNAKGLFGPPSHEKMIFELYCDTTVTCRAMYLKKERNNR